MRKILIGLVMGGAGAAIALGVRDDLTEHGGAASPRDRAVAEATRGPVGERPGEAGATSDASGEFVVSVPADPGSRGVTGGSGTRAEPGGAAEGAGRPDNRGAAAGAAGALSVAGGGAKRAEAAESAAQEPTGDAVLLRAAKAYEAIRGLRADFVQVSENPLLRNRVTSRGTLYQRRPDRFLMKFEEPAGDVIVSDGRWIWVFYPSVDDEQVLRSPVSAAGAGGVDLQALFLGDPLERFTVRYEGREMVDGRAAHVLHLTPREPVGYRSLKAWVDARDYLARRFEIVEENGVMRRFDLHGLEVNPTLPDSLFEFTPPAGARIIERG